MNTKILSKCIDELKKETPNISYVLGILETLIDIDDKTAEMGGGSLSTSLRYPIVPKSEPNITLTPAEQSVADAMNILDSGIKPMATGAIETNVILK